MEHTAASRLMAGSQANQSAAVQSAEFESVVKLYRPRIFRFVLASLRDPDMADTLTQDCFLRAHRAWAGFRHDCSMETWLLRIAVNLVRDHARNRRLQFWRRAERVARPVESVSEWFADGARSPEQQALLQEQVQAVWDA
ncbi:MAG: RNA polymerase sigma factor, partial [Acidobacteria bacterium]|nr:RNA polymerase sigma factor [Acidobacteriota bacterium]